MLRLVLLGSLVGLFVVGWGMSINSVASAPQVPKSTPCCVLMLPEIERAYVVSQERSTVTPTPSPSGTPRPHPTLWPTWTQNPQCPRRPQLRYLPYLLYHLGSDRVSRGQKSQTLLPSISLDFVIRTIL